MSTVSLVAASFYDTSTSYLFLVDSSHAILRIWLRMSFGVCSPFSIAWILIFIQCLPIALISLTAALYLAASNGCRYCQYKCMVIPQGSSCNPGNNTELMRDRHTLYPGKRICALTPLVDKVLRVLNPVLCFNFHTFSVSSASSSSSSNTVPKPTYCTIIMKVINPAWLKQ